MDEKELCQEVHILNLDKFEKQTTTSLKKNHPRATAAPRPFTAGTTVRSPVTQRPFNDAMVRSGLSPSSFYVASESKFTSMCYSTRSSQPTLEQVRAVHEISSTCALGTFVGMSEQKEKPHIFLQHFDPASHEFLIYFFCAIVRPRRLWQSHKDEYGLRSSSWFPSEFLAEGGLPR
uniref:Uncharacterized protein n=1 Tax=Aegilops tauschii subsp. strangulata TaxID=200361 RepID=A0A453BHY8_AEGTS